jgi:hypothetical protein
VASNRIDSEEENENEINVTVSNNQFKNTQSQLKEVIDNSNTDNTNYLNSEDNIQTNSLLNKIEDFKVEKLIQLANKDEYPHKLFIIEGKEYFYTPVCHFFKSDSIFVNKPKTVKFECKIKNCVLNCSFGALTNLNKHLFKHDESRRWYKKYQDHLGVKPSTGLTDGQLNLIKLFVSSYQSLNLLKNEYFRKLCSNSVHIPSEVYFRYDFLKEVIEKLHHEIEVLLKKALVVTLIPDIWESNLIHRLGLGVTLVFDSFDRQLLIIGIEIIQGSNAEAIKITTESIINKYDFDKKKIRSI